MRASAASVAVASGELTGTHGGRDRGCGVGAVGSGTAIGSNRSAVPGWRHGRSARGTARRTRRPRRRRRRWSPPTTPSTRTPSHPEQRVAFGTSGHRGSSLDDDVQRGPHRRDQPGDLRVPRGAGHRRPAVPRRATRTRCPSRPPSSALEVFAANDVTVLIDSRGGYTPTPVGVARDPRPQPRPDRRIAPTASSSPRRTTRRRDGGFKYNPPDGGPADTEITGWIQDRANELLARRPATACGACRTRGRCRPTPRTLRLPRRLRRRLPQRRRPRRDPRGRRAHRRRPARRRSGRLLGRDRRALRARPDRREPDWSTRRSRFMTLDWDGKIRMDCSSPYAMASLIAQPATTSTSRPATTPTPTGTASSRPTAG